MSDWIKTQKKVFVSQRNELRHDEKLQVRNSVPVGYDPFECYYPRYVEGSDLGKNDIGVTKWGIWSVYLVTPDIHAWGITNYHRFYLVWKTEDGTQTLLVWDRKLADLDSYHFKVYFESVYDPESGQVVVSIEERSL